MRTARDSKMCTLEAQSSALWGKNAKKDSILLDLPMRRCRQCQLAVAQPKLGAAVVCKNSGEMME